MLHNVVSLSQLIKEDLKEAYVYPVRASSSCQTARFLNKGKYQIYDYPSWSKELNEILIPQSICCVLGDEVPFLTDHIPLGILQEHWERWLPVFQPAKYISIKQGLNDSIPVVTLSPFESIPVHKHHVNPDVSMKLQLKSSLPTIGVPCPRHMDANVVQFPCVLKVDHSNSGRGNYLLKSMSELDSSLEEIQIKNGWKGNVIYQEFIPNVVTVPSYTFYLKKNGEIVWLGSCDGKFQGFHWKSLIMDYNQQEKKKELIYETFAVPIANYLHKNGFFGIANFELAVDENEQSFLIDLNPRFPGELAHKLMASYFENMGFPLSHFLINSNSCKMSVSTLVERANKLNESQAKGKIVISSGFDVGNNQCQNIASIFTTNEENAQDLINKLFP